jgi:hypothetical protein
MANMNNLFEILDASDADDLDFAAISAQLSDISIEDCCCCCCCC